MTDASDSKMRTANRPVGFGTLVAYGLGDIYGGGSFMIVGLLFMFYLTEVVGLSPALAGLVFGIGKVWDAVTDPLMGYISDRTQSRFGRRRVYFLAGIIPIAISFILMWVPLRVHSQGALFAYYSVAYILFATVFTMVMIPYSALAAELSGDYKVRNRLSGAPLLLGLFLASRRDGAQDHHRRCKDESFCGVSQHVDSLRHLFCVALDHRVLRYLGRTGRRRRNGIAQFHEGISQYLRE